MARSGMSDLINTVRGMANAGTADYSIGNTTYWSDNEIQRVLDRHKFDINRSELQSVQAYEGAGTIVYKEYHAVIGNLESGTAVFELELSTGGSSGTAYTMDYTRGIATFDNNQAGTAHFMTAKTYDLNAAAADLFRMKASQASSAISFSTDKHRVDRSKLKEGYLDMAAYYSSFSAPKTVQMVRTDLG